MAMPKSTSCLEEQAVLQDDWHTDAVVQKLLVWLLEQPWADHEPLVRQLLQGAPLSDVHVHGLFAFAKSDAAMQLLASHGRSRSFALHCWLYHLLGGASGELSPPPSEKHDERSGSDTARMWTRAGRLSEKFLKSLRSLTKNTPKDAAGAAEVQRQLLALRSARITIERLSVERVPPK